MEAWEMLLMTQQLIKAINQRQSPVIDEMVEGSVEYSTRADPTLIHSLPEFASCFPSVYWHVEENQCLLEGSTVKFPLIQYWRTKENSHKDDVKKDGRFEDHWVCHFRTVQWNQENKKIISSCADLDPERVLSIREKRKLKRKALKFHGKRNDQHAKQEQRKHEAEQYRAHGDQLSAEEREQIRAGKREKWKRKHKKFEKRQEQKERVLELTAQMNALESEYWPQQQDAPSWPIGRVCIDLSFLPVMDSFARGSIRNQLLALYQCNLEANCPFRVYLAADSDSQVDLEVLIGKLDGVEKWAGFSVHPGVSVEDVLPPHMPVVYLSPDATEVLEEVDNHHLYVIGGICDRDREKNMTQTKCERKGIQSRRLPIDEYVSLGGNKILTINGVFSILCDYREHQNWVRAFCDNLPGRAIDKIRADE